VYSDSDGDITVPIYLPNKLSKPAKKHCKYGCSIAIKEMIYIIDNNVCIIANKLSMIAGSNQ
jgi:hypothetical protein